MLIVHASGRLNGINSHGLDTADGTKRAVACPRRLAGRKRELANFQNRTRVVYVRVSEDEFRHFRELRQQHGAKNMSDLVRSAMGAMVRQQASEFERDVTQRLQQLEASLVRLNRTVEQMVEGKPA